MTLTLGVGVSEQFSKHCEIEVVVYEVKMKKISLVILKHPAQGNMFQVEQP